MCLARIVKCKIAFLQLRLVSLFPSQKYLQSACFDCSTLIACSAQTLSSPMQGGHGERVPLMQNISQSEHQCHWAGVFGTFSRAATMEHQCHAVGHLATQALAAPWVPIAAASQPTGIQSELDAAPTGWGHLGGNYLALENVIHNSAVRKMNSPGCFLGERQ